MKFLKRIVARWAREGREADENYEDRKYPEVGRGSARGLTKKNVSSYYGDQGEGAEFKNPMRVVGLLGFLDGIGLTIQHRKQPMSLTAVKISKKH